MPGFLLWIFAVYGIVFLLADSKIFSQWIPLRPYLERNAFFAALLSCYFCLGVWVALGLYLLCAFTVHASASPFEGLVYVFAGAAGAFVLHRVQGLIDVLIHVLLKPHPDEPSADSE